jgi:hypothetical protein
VPRNTPSLPSWSGDSSTVAVFGGSAHGCEQAVLVGGPVNRRHRASDRSNGTGQHLTRAAADGGDVGEQLLRADLVEDLLLR